MAKTTATKEEKKQAGIDLAMNFLTKKFGEGTLQRFSDKANQQIDPIPTGILSVDELLGIGGFPLGRLIEIYGAQSVGKSTLCMTLARQAQQLTGKSVAYIDAEHCLDGNYLSALGVDLDELFFTQPSSAEEALTTVEKLLESEAFSLIIVDSVAAMTPQVIVEGEIGDQTIGVKARLLGQSVPKLTTLAAKSNTCVIFVNQIRDVIGGMGYGPKTDTPGGKTLKFQTSLRVELKDIGQIKDGDKVVGKRIRFKVVKSKVAPPFRDVDYDLIFGEGISRENDLIDLGVKHEVLSKAGSWHTFGEHKHGSREKFRLFLNGNPDVSDELEAKIKEKLNAE
jgi:recombination protein RecA